MKSRELLRLVTAQVCVHSAMTGARLAAPLLALQLGYSAAQVGVLLAALFALSPVVLALRAGRLADRHGLRVPLRLAVGAAMLGTALAAAWPTFGVLCVMALLTGASAGTAQIAAPRGPRGGAPVEAENGVQLDRHCAGHGEFSRPAGHWPADRPRGAAAGA